MELLLPVIQVGLKHPAVTHTVLRWPHADLGMNSEEFVLRFDVCVVYKRSTQETVRMSELGLDHCVVSLP